MIFFSNKLSGLLFVAVFIIIFFVCIISIQIENYNISTQGSSFDGEFIWPLPGYNYISSYFGKRNSPTQGASSYHSGIDIPAPAGTKILAVCSGNVSFCSWGARSEGIQLLFKMMMFLFLIVMSPQIF